MRESVRQGWFWHWGRTMYRFRWAVVAFWIACFLGFGLFAQKAPELLKDNGFTPYGSESEQGLQKLQANLGFPENIRLVRSTENSSVCPNDCFQFGPSFIGQQADPIGSRFVEPEYG